METGKLIGAALGGALLTGAVATTFARYDLGHTAEERSSIQSQQRPSSDDKGAPNEYRDEKPVEQKRAAAHSSTVIASLPSDYGLEDADNGASPHRRSECEGTWQGRHDRIEVTWRSGRYQLTADHAGGTPAKLDLVWADHESIRRGTGDDGNINAEEVYAAAGDVADDNVQFVQMVCGHGRAALVDGQSTELLQRK